MHKTENSRSVKFSEPRLASFDHLDLMSDPHMNFRKPRNKFNGRKGPENINYTIVKYGDVIYDWYTSLPPE